MRGDDPILDVAGVSKAFGPLRALSGVDLAVGAGEIVALLGPNGAGKTTLISVVVGLLRPDEGTVAVAGIDALHRPERVRGLIGFAPQVTGVYEPITVEENLVFYARLAGLRRRRSAQRIGEVCQALVLEDLRSRTCAQLSGGEKRRLHTAIAILSRPQLLLLDEPTVGADIETRQALLAVVRQLASDGTAIVYSTHYLPEIEALDASVVLLDSGRIIARGTVESLLDAHGSGVLDLRFSGPAPALVTDHVPVERDGSHLRITTTAPGLTVPWALGELGEDIGRLESLDVRRPSLDSVFLRLTGHRLPETEEDSDRAS